MKITNKQLKQIIKEELSYVLNEMRGGAEQAYIRSLRMNPEKHMERENEKFLQTPNKFIFISDVQPYRIGKEPGTHWIITEYDPDNYNFKGKSYWLKDCSKNQAIGTKTQLTRKARQYNSRGNFIDALADEGASDDLLGNLSSVPDLKFRLQGPFSDEIMQNNIKHKNSHGFDFVHTLDRMQTF